MGQARTANSDFDASVPSIFGRGDDYAAVLAQVTGPQQLVTLTGRSGVGKTRLALEVLHNARRLGMSRATLVELSAVTDARLVPTALAAGLEVPCVRGQEPLDAVAHSIAADRRFVVIDNFEHVVAAADSISELLDRCSGLRLLVTSQAPLHVGGERVVHLDPLPVPSEHATPDEIETNPAVQLYCERASEVSRTFAYDATNAEAIAELCRRLEGMPLAIELAAVRAGALPASEVVDRLDSVPFDVLRQPRPDAPARHHDLRSAINWTYSLLADDEQRLLRRVSVTNGAFDIDEAAALDREPVGATLDRVARLADLRFVELVANTRPAQFSMPWSIRTFARERLEEAGEAQHQRHVQVELQADRTRARTADVDIGESDDWLTRAAADEPKLLGALEDALVFGMAEESLRIVTGLDPIWDVRGYHPAHEQLVDRVLALAAECNIETSAHADVLSWSVRLGLAQISGAQQSVLVHRLRQAEMLARSADDEDSLLLALSAVVLASQWTGDFGAAEIAAGEALERLKKDGSRRRWRARFEAWTGMLAQVAGDDARATEFGLRALTRAKRENDKRTVVIALILLRPLVARSPDLDAKIPSTTETLELAHSQGFADFESMLRPMVAVEAAARGDARRSLELGIDALVFARSFRTSPNAALSLYMAVVVLVANGEHEAAAHVHGVVRRGLRVIDSALVPSQRETYARATNEAREKLGTIAFDRAADDGARLDWGEGIAVALEYLRNLARDDAYEAVASSGLTQRQLDTLALVATGLTNKEIAVRLGITPKTVMHHLTIVYQMLGVRTRTEAALWAIANGIGD